MTLKRLLWAGIGLISLVSLLIGGRALWAEVTRPSAAPEELRVIDARPQPISLPITASDPETITLLTIVEPDTDSNLALPPALPDGVTVDEALMLAAEINPAVPITEIRLRREQGVLVYRVTFGDRMRVLIDAGSGQVLEIDPRGEDDDNGYERLGQGVDSDIAITDAIALVAGRYPGTRLERAKLEEEDGQLIYTIRLDNGLEIRLDANTGAYLDPSQNDEGVDEAQSQSGEATVSIERALQIARERFPNLVVSELELTTEDGRLVYDIEFDGGVAVYLDAATGRIVEVEGTAE